MKKINKKKIIELLEKNIVDNSSPILDIKGGGTDFYIFDDNINEYLGVYDYGKEPYYDIASMNTDFFIECLKQIKFDNYDFVKLSVINREFLMNTHLTSIFQVNNINSYSDLRFSSNLSFNDLASNIRKLTKNDRDIAENVLHEQTEGRPPFTFLFEHFVEKENGVIHSIIENQKIIAFLSSFNTYKNISDVDYIYVFPHKRGLGYGTDLIKAYVIYSLKNNTVPVYNHAVNKYSINAAEKVGFKKIRTVYTCELKKIVK